LKIGTRFYHGKPANSLSTSSEKMPAAQGIYFEHIPSPRNSANGCTLHATSVEVEDTEGTSLPPPLSPTVGGDMVLLEDDDQPQRPKQRYQKGLMVGPPGNQRMVYPGDLCVHKKYGLCKFLRSGETSIDVRFADRDEHTFGIGHAELLTRFKSREQAGRRPRLAKYENSDMWAAKMEKVKLKTDALARDIMLLYAERDSMYRDPCEPDGKDMWEFEDAFPFTPTADQSKAMEEIMKDMVWRKRPMDRLVCGDVGFGKTEVAMRAIYRAVLNGRQVAVLAPTTVLAAQHLRTLRNRMPEVKIDILRGGNSKHNKNVKAQLEAGLLEVIVGTHSLLARTVVFKNLGLLIVDEEQRFGVSQKEKLKAASSGVDVLTLSATPIPRTLQMSLSGIRDMSTLFTPPSGRKNVTTHIGTYNEEAIRHALEFELARDGQVYYVVPRISMLDEAAEIIKSLIPGIRVLICHGQMKEVEERIIKFTYGQADVLVATSIIENGLDIPNVNTMIVQDANMFGLAALYQLRGRVGRSAKKAYAYLFYSAGRLTSDAMMRLMALKQLSHLGSGYELSQRDLEIRGAGNVLGTQQSGEIGEMGFDLYMQVLDESMAELRGTSIQPSLQCNVEIKDLDLGCIPDDYMATSEDRRRENNRARVADSKEELVEIAQQWTQQFGEIPETTKVMLKVRHLQVAGKALGLEAIGQRQQDIILRAQNMEWKNWELLAQQIPAHLTRYDMDFEPKGPNGPEVIIEKLASQPPSIQVNYLLGIFLNFVEYIKKTQKRVELLRQ